MNEFEQAEERRKRQREEIKQKRIRQLRRRMTISGCILLCIIIALAAFAVNVAKKKKLAAEQKKQLEQEIAQMNESLNDCYNTFLSRMLQHLRNGWKRTILKRWMIYFWSIRRIKR